MKCFVCSVALHGAETLTVRMGYTTRSVSDVDMEKDGACKMDRQNKKMQLCLKEWEKEE